MGRFGWGAVLVLVPLGIFALWTLFKLIRTLQRELASAKALDTPELLQSNPRLARNLRILREMHETLLWILLGVIGWVIFLYVAWNYSSYEIRMPVGGA